MFGSKLEITNVGLNNKNAIFSPKIITELLHKEVEWLLLV